MKQRHTDIYESSQHTPPGQIITWYEYDQSLPPKWSTLMVTLMVYLCGLYYKIFTIVNYDLSHTSVCSIPCDHKLQSYNCNLLL